MGKKVKNYKDYIMYNESVNGNSFDFKQLFLELTKYTVPFGYEKTLESILYSIVPNLKKDEYGNYHIKIGNSKTLFTSHLDTYSKRREKINHVVNGDKISTDGTTILGGDNKNGVLILLYMITKNKPGNYYFFVGEEGIVTGKSCNGSNWLLKNNSSIYTSVDRAIAFDRRGKGSIVTKQRGRHCCSDEFADALVEQFGDNGLSFKKDYAYGTDSAVFMDIVPEITNISSGGEYEHSFMEFTNINYTKRIANAAVKIDWESLPTIRKPEPVDTSYSDREWNDTTHSVNKRVFRKISAMLGVKGFNCINNANFKPSAVMHFRQFTGDKFIDLKFINRKAFVINDNYFDEDKEIKKFTPLELKEILDFDVETLSKKVISRIVNKMDQSYKLSRGKLNIILNKYHLSYVDFKNYIEKSDDYKNLFEFGENEIYMDVVANQATTIKRQREQEGRE
jgi:hypothetical protein